MSDLHCKLQPAVQAAAAVNLSLFKLYMVELPSSIKHRRAHTASCQQSWARLQAHNLLEYPCCPFWRVILRVSGFGRKCKCQDKACFQQKVRQARIPIFQANASLQG